jgi:hypothetical protein
LHACQSRLQCRFLGVIERGLEHRAASALERLKYLLCVTLRTRPINTAIAYAMRAAHLGIDSLL